MATLKEFEDALRARGMTTALGILDELKQRDRAKRSVAPARRVTGRKMTPDIARRILDLHGSTKMTQQEIAFQLGVNQGRVNEVIKRGKWLDGSPRAPEAVARDKALRRARSSPQKSLAATIRPPVRRAAPSMLEAHRAGETRRPRSEDRAQLSFGDL